MAATANWSDLIYSRLDWLAVMINSFCRISTVVSYSFILILASGLSGKTENIFNLILYCNFYFFHLSCTSVFIVFYGALSHSDLLEEIVHFTDSVVMNLDADTVHIDVSSEASANP